MPQTNPSDDETRRQRRHYGRGLYDGLRLAGIDDPEGFMNEARLQKAEQGLNGVAKKVLDAVPMQAPWTKAQIVAEIRRVGSNAGVDVIEGCLNTLRGRGLISEPARGEFVRIQAKPRVHLVQTMQPAEETVTAPQPIHQTAMHEDEDPLTKLAAIAESARALAKQVEDVAIDVQQQLDQNKRDTEKLRQFQALLKSLGS